MSKFNYGVLSLLASVVSLVIMSEIAMAASILPTTSVLIIEEANREGSIGIKNTQSTPLLLYTKVLRLDDDDLDAALIPSPAAVLVQPGETQIVRLLFRSNKKLDKEHLARVIFMGISPENKSQKSAHIDFMVGQDLPVVIRPRGYVPVENKWEFLQWRIKDRQLCVANTTKLAIRFVNNVTLLPGLTPITMPKAYALPGSENCAALPVNYSAHSGIKVQFAAVSDYSYVIADQQANVDIVPATTG